MSKRRHDELVRLYTGMTQEAMRAAYGTAVQIGSKKAAEHAEVIEELLDAEM